MTRHENLRILAFVGSGATAVVEYLTEKSFPKVNVPDMSSQIEHLADAGQHRIVTDAILDVESFRNVAHEFPGELRLVSVDDGPNELSSMAHHHITSDPEAINKLLDKLDFRL
jgi:hypothetical protein